MHSNRLSASAGTRTPAGDVGEDDAIPRVVHGSFPFWVGCAGVPADARVVKTASSSSFAGQPGRWPWVLKCQPHSGQRPGPVGGTKPLGLACCPFGDGYVVLSPRIPLQPCNRPVQVGCRRLRVAPGRAAGRRHQGRESPMTQRPGLPRLSSRLRRYPSSAATRSRRLTVDLSSRSVSRDSPGHDTRTAF